MAQNNSDIDKSLYSRQLYAIGKDAQEALKNTSVLISGMSGLGVEIAKNLILTGVKSVTLHDCGEIRLKELSTNYYAKFEDVGKSRVSVKNELAQLNPYVNVTVNTEPITENLIKRHQVVIICDKLPPNVVQINDVCRQYRTKLIVANTIGLLGIVFCDFGDNFTVNDQDGETPSTGILVQSDNDIITTSEPHKLYVGDNITIKLEDQDDYTDTVSKVIDSQRFKLTKNKIPNKQLTNSSFTQIKTPLTINFKPLSESLNNPQFSNVYTEDFSRQNLLHNFMFSLSMFIIKNGSYPRPWNDDDANEILVSTKCENESQEQAIKKLCYTASGKTILLDSIIGSIVSQEVVKATTKKYTPTNQWMFIERTDILPDEKISEDEFQDIPQNRHFGQTLIFGKSMQQKIQESNVFVVGAGAIGCEHLKNLVMLGVNNITITDMDRIEKSNLSRQFLFRNSDIGKFKSDSAKNAVLKMNPEVNITAQQNKICSDTLNIYNKDFFSQFTCIMTALDNVEARVFVDDLCLTHGKHLIDSGTLGTKGNTQIVVPFLTETYGQTRDPPEKDIPVCTLKNFPYLIEHCIQWARDMFEGLFVKSPQNFLEFKKNPDKIKSMTPTELAEMIDDINLVKNNYACYEKECIKFAYKLWHEKFRDQIQHLTEQYRADAKIVDEKTKEEMPFWSGTKKFPKVLNFNVDELNIAFIEAVANLWAEVCMLKEKITQKQILQFVKKVSPPLITHKTTKIASNEQQQKELDEQAKGKPLDELLDLLPTNEEIESMNVKTLEFEKDDDTNFHIDFVTSTSNLRATNYGIVHADKFKTKGIAGKIIPAVVTTTALVSGLVSAELIKVIRGENRIEKYYNTFSNLALPVLAFSEPIKIATKKMGNLEYSLWNNFKFDDLTINEIITNFDRLIGDERYVLNSISLDKPLLFSTSFSSEKIEKRKKMKISEIYKEVMKTEPNDVISILCCIDNEDDDNDGDSFSCQIRIR